MKQPWDPITLRMNYWYGAPAVVGDELETLTGRRYQILRIQGKRHDCMVLPDGAPVQGTVHQFRWGKR